MDISPQLNAYLIEVKYCSQQHVEINSWENRCSVSNLCLMRTVTLMEHCVNVLFCGQKEFFPFLFCVFGKFLPYFPYY